MDFYTFARDSLYLNFWSDNLVFMCIGFDLVDLFDKWVYGFTNGGCLRFTYGGNLGVWILSCDSW